jgi:hypothetical protein
MKQQKWRHIYPNPQGGNTETTEVEIYIPYALGGYCNNINGDTYIKGV